jgi:hypothetical protein
MARTIRLIGCSAYRAAPATEGANMTFRTSAVLAMTFAGFLATGVQAQVRMEPAESAFVWEALGATPSIQLKNRAAAAVPSAKPARAATQAPASPAAPNEFTYDALGGTPKIKRSQADASAATATAATTTSTPATTK